MATQGRQPSARRGGDERTRTSVGGAIRADISVRVHRVEGGIVRGKPGRDLLADKRCTWAVDSLFSPLLSPILRLPSCLLFSVLPLYLFPFSHAAGLDQSRTLQPAQIKKPYIRLICKTATTDCKSVPLQIPTFHALYFSDSRRHCRLLVARRHSTTRHKLAHD